MLCQYFPVFQSQVSNAHLWIISISRHPTTDIDIHIHSYLYVFKRKTSIITFLMIIVSMPAPHLHFAGNKTIQRPSHFHQPSTSFNSLIILMPAVPMLLALHLCLLLYLSCWMSVLAYYLLHQPYYRFFLEKKNDVNSILSQGNSLYYVSWVKSLESNSSWPTQLLEFQL